jgi:nucleotide-binding universal stress UspA family protein
MKQRPLSLLVPVDFSPASVKALRVAEDLARRVRGTVTLLHVRPISDVRAAVLEERGDLLRGSSQALRQGLATHYGSRLDSLKDRFGEAAVTLARGKASHEIRRAARRGFDYVVMGGRGRGGLGRLLGGTAQKVLAGCPIPVLVVPSG